MAVFGGDARTQFIHSLGNILTPRNVSPTNAGRNVSGPIVDSYFQQAALTGGDLEKIYGDADTFLKRYEKFEAKYHRALETDLKGGQRNKLLADLSKKRNTLDFNLLNREAAEGLMHEYKTEILKLDHVMHAHGAPKFAMPSANAFRTSWMFDMDFSQGVQHPVQLVLSKLMLGHNSEKTGMESISIGRSGMISSSMFRDLWGRYKNDPMAKKPMGDLKGGQRILTFDTETTGISRYSQVRSMSVAEMVVDKNTGELSGPKSLEHLNFGFHAEEFNNTHVSSIFGETRTLNEHVAQSEGFKNFSEFGVGGQDFLDKSTEFINALLGADKIVAHNAAFDLDMLTKTMANQSNFGKHLEAQKAIGALHERIKGGDFLFDTLDTTRLYLRGQVQKAMEHKRATTAGISTPTPSLSESSNKFIRNLFSEEARANIKIGGSATYSGVGDVALNTNLFELIEKEKGNAATDLFEKMSAGSHVADTDTHLQSYIAKYIEEGKLKINALHERDGGTFTEFGKFLRAKIAKSAATTVTTDIRSVHKLSLENLNYFLGTDVADQTTSAGIETMADRLKSVSVKVEKDQFGKHGEGFLKFHGGNFKVFSGVDELDVDTRAANEHIQTIIRDSMKGESKSTLDINGTSRSVVRNIADEKINTFGISYGTASAADDMRRLRSLTRPTEELNKTTILEGLSAPYEHATGFSIGQRLQTIVHPEKKISPFQRGIKQISETKSNEMANKMMAIGNKYAGLIDDRGKVLGTVLAESTADITRAAGASVLKGSEEVLAHSKYAQGLASFGISSFKKQETTRLFRFGETSGSVLASSKPMVHSDIIAHIMKQSESIALGGGTTHLRNAPLMAGLSTVEYGSAPKVNLVLDINQQFGAEGSRELAERLIDLHLDDASGSAHSKIAAALNIDQKHLSDSAKQTATEVKEAVERLGREGAVDELAGFIHKRGVVHGYVEGNPAAAIIDNLAGMGMDPSNEEAGIKMRGYVTDSHSQSTVSMEAVHDVEAAKMAGVEKDIETFAAGAEEVAGRRVSAAQHGARQAVESLDRSGDLESVMAKVNRARDGIGAGSLVEFYNANKRNIGIGAAAVAAAGVGYYLHKRHKERELYNETFDAQPTEKNRGVRMMNSSASNQTRFNNDISNPLATAGVVGNLDRMKIGHTRMGNNKHAHLFGG